MDAGLYTMAIVIVDIRTAHKCQLIWVLYILLIGHVYQPVRLKKDLSGLLSLVST